MNEVREFLTALGKDPRAKELLKGKKEPANTEEAAEQYLSIAEKLGYKVTKEDILVFLNKQEQFLREKAEKAESAVKTALDEEALDLVAGGTGDNPGCAETFSPGEWCWITDSCSTIINGYSGSDLNEVAPDPSGACKFDQYCFDTTECIENGIANDEWWFVEQQCVGDAL